MYIDDAEIRRAEIKIKETIFNSEVGMKNMKAIIKKQEVIIPPAKEK